MNNDGDRTSEQEKNALAEIEKIRVNRNKQDLTLTTLRKKRKVKPKEVSPDSGTKSPLSIMDRMKQSEQKSKVLQKEIEKKDSLARIEQVYKDKIIGGNQLLVQNIAPKFVDILTNLHRENNPKLYSGDQPIEFKEDRMAKRALRKESQSELDTQIRQRLSWLQMDISSSFEEKLALVQGIDIEDVEMVTKIRYYNDQVEYETNEGVYSFPVEEAQKFGGYVIHQVRILTEELKLHKIMKGMVSRTKEVSDRYKNLFWLMVEPFIAFTEEGKVLLLDTSHLIESMTEYFQRRVANPSFNAKEVDLFQKSRKALFMEDRKLVEYIDKNLEIPQTNMAVTFPYHLLEKSGVQFELKYKPRDRNSISNVVLTQNLVKFRNFEVERLRNESTETYLYYRGASMEIEKQVTKIIKASSKPVKDENVNKRKENKNKQLEEEKDLIQQMLEEQDAENDKYLRKLSKEQKIKKAIQEDLEKEKKEEEEMNEGETEEDILYNLSKSREINYVALDKEFNVMVKLLASFEPAKVGDIGLNIGKYIPTNIGLVTILNMASKSLQSIKYSIEKTQSFIDEINDYAGDRRKEINAKIHTTIGSYNNTLNINLQYTNELIEYYKNIKDRYQSVNSALHAHIPISLSNIDAEIVTQQGYPINLAPMIIDRMLLDRDIYREVESAGQYARPVIGNPRKMMYVYIREMIKFFKSRDIYVINWLELMKLMVPESVSYLSQIRDCPELRELVACEKVVHLLRTVSKGGRNKVRKIDDSVEWSDVRDRKTNSLPPLTESENRFNLMMADIFNHHIGYLCTIDFENLINYIINLDDIRDIEGEEIVKYIPLPQLINKYFNINEISPQYPKLGQDLFKEIKTVPPVIIAIQHILTTGKEYMESYKSSESFKKLEEMAIQYGIQKKKVFSDSKIKEEAGIENSLSIRVEELSVDYKNLNDILTKRYNKTFEYVKLDLTNYKDFKEFRKNLEEYGEQLKDLNPGIYDEINRLRLELDTVLKTHEKITRLRIEGQVTKRSNQIQESLDIIQKYKEDISAQGINYIDNTMDLIESYYDYEKSYNELLSTVAKLKLDYVPNIGVLVNLIKSMADELPQPLSGAFLHVANDFIVNLKHIQDSNPFKTPKSRALTIVQMFNVITEAMGVNSPLSPTAEDTDKMEQRFQAEQDQAIQDNKPDMSEDEKKEVTEFLSSLGNVDTHTIPSVVRGYVRKDLIPDTLYEELAYPKNGYYGKGYEDLYSTDFSLAENLKMRLEVGLSLKPEHLEDTRLMECVNNIIIDEKFLETLKE